VIEFWSCLGHGEDGVGHVPCDAHGEGPTSDLDARKHMEATQHGVRSGTRPA